MSNPIPLITIALFLFILLFVAPVLHGCTLQTGQRPPPVPPAPTVRFCLVQREIVLRRGDVLRSVELQPCVPAEGEFR